MTKDEAKVVMAYTGISIGEFSEFHGYAEELLGRPIFTHEFGSPSVMMEIKEKAREDFIMLKVTEE